MKEKETLELLVARLHKQWANATLNVLTTLRPILPGKWVYCPFCGQELENHKADCKDTTDIAVEVLRWIELAQKPYSELDENERLAYQSTTTSEYEVE